MPSDTLNALLMLGVMIPPALLVHYHRVNCDAGEGDAGGGTGAPELFDAARAVAKEWAGGEVGAASCHTYLHLPFLFVNLLYFVVVDLGFWGIYLAQGSTWLIDPHWQFIPVCIAGFYYSHPSAAASNPRAWIAMVLVLVWAGRLLHNYFRRERWHFGRVEDWRYADMRKSHGKWWWLTQFFAVSLAQHGMLVGLTMPLQPAMMDDNHAINVLDVLAIGICLAGIVFGALSDNQLWDYMQLEKSKKPIVLDTGLWRYSRHPNHFGEQAWWCGILCLGVAAGAGFWPICFGVLFNHPLDGLVTLQLIEQRMLRRPERNEQFRAYQRRTSLLVPMPPRA